MAVLLLVAAPLVAHATSSLPRFRNETELVILAVLGGLVYGGLWSRCSGAGCFRSSAAAAS